MGKTENEEKKKFLRSYQDSVRRIERIRSEIEEIKTMKMGMSTNSSGVTVRRKGQKNDLSGYVANLDDLERTLNEEWKTRILQYKEVRNAIGTVKDAREQDVLFYRYIKRLSWWEIAGKMGYTERWVLDFHSKALAHLNLKKTS